jgi:hypothetical protein
MRNSWRHFFRRLAVVSFTIVSTAWWSAMCHAQLAADFATDPVYANGWQGTTTNNTTGAVDTTGDNGGFGFEPWNFDTDWLFNPDPIDGIQAVDDGLKAGAGNPDSSPFNDIGRAWRMDLPEPVGDNGGLPRAGRGFAPLQVGQTIRLVVDTPTDRRFFKGYFIRFNSRNGEAGGGNICYDFPGYSNACSAADLNGNGNYVPLGATPTPKLVIQRFEYANDGQWVIGNGEAEAHDIPLFDTDTAQGAQIDLTLTGVDTYSLTIDPLGAGPTHTETGALDTPGEPIDWIEFTFFNTTSTLDTASDLYIKSMEILGPAPEGVPGDYNDNGTVDAADYVLWRNGGPLQNEVAGATPGQVTAEDYAAWRAWFGNTSAGAAGSQLQAASVPEPGTFVVVIGIVAAGLVFCGPFRSRAQNVE